MTPIAQAKSYSVDTLDLPVPRKARLHQDDAAAPVARRKLLAYTSIHQFSQMVEVYRGRCAAGSVSQLTGACI